MNEGWYNDGSGWFYLPGLQQGQPSQQYMVNPPSDIGNNSYGTSQQHLQLQPPPRTQPEDYFTPQYGSQQTQYQDQMPTMHQQQPFQDQMYMMRMNQHPTYQNQGYMMDLQQHPTYQNQGYMMDLQHDSHSDQLAMHQLQSQQSSQQQVINPLPVSSSDLYRNSHLQGGQQLQGHAVSSKDKVSKYTWLLMVYTDGEMLEESGASLREEGSYSLCASAIIKQCVSLSDLV